MWSRCSTERRSAGLSGSTARGHGGAVRKHDNNTKRHRAHCPHAQFRWGVNNLPINSVVFSGLRGGGTGLGCSKRRECRYRAAPVLLFPGQPSPVRSRHDLHNESSVRVCLCGSPG
jgi:hypothetical protein